MVPVLSLWMPILLSAVLVFVASSVVHMVFTWHRSDFSRLPDESGASAALGSLNLPPGDYMYPYASSPAEMKDPAFLERLNRGPRVIMTVLPRGPGSMGPQLVRWFVYCAFVSLFAAYVAGVVLAPGTEYMLVFRVAGTVAFCGYALALWQGVVWYGRNPNAIIKSTFDGLLYGLITGGAFGWLWP